VTHISIFDNFIYKSDIFVNIAMYPWSSVSNTWNQSYKGDTLGPELKRVCMLFRDSSPVVSEALSTIIKYVAAESSLIAMLPFIGSTVLRTLLQDRTSAHLPEHYTPEIKMQLSGLTGRPVFSKLLTEICSHVTDVGSRGRNSSVLRDCDVVIAFLLYLCDNVQLAFESDVRARLMTRIADEGWSLAEGGGPGEAGSGGYDTRSFLHSGIHSPNLPKVRERGDYPKDKKAADETSAHDGGCDKPFASSRKKTGNPMNLPFPRQACDLSLPVSVSAYHWHHDADHEMYYFALCRGALYLRVQTSCALRMARHFPQRREE
jgi:hypothetical protein